MLSVVNLNATVGDWARNYNYKLDILELPAGLTAADHKRFTDAMDLYCTTSPIPDQKVAMQKMKWGGEFAWWSTVDDSSGTLEIKFKIDKDWRAYDFFFACKSLLRDSETGGGHYKGNCVFALKLSLVDLDRETVKKVFILRNCQCSEVQKVDLSKEGDKYAEATAIINFEKLVKKDSDLGSV